MSMSNPFDTSQWPEKFKDLTMSFVSDDKRDALLRVVERAKGDAYSLRAFEYGYQWAALMESRMRLDQSVKVAAIAEGCGHEADYDGITGNMYSYGVAMASDCWIHGAELRVWHNERYIDSAEELAKINASGGVVNTSVLEITTTKKKEDDKNT